MWACCCVMGLHGGLKRRLVRFQAICYHLVEFQLWVGNFYCYIVQLASDKASAALQQHS